MSRIRFMELIFRKDNLCYNNLKVPTFPNADNPCPWVLDSNAAAEEESALTKRKVLVHIA